MKYPKRYKQFKTETKNRKQMEKQKRNFQKPFSPGWCLQPGLKFLGKLKKCPPTRPQRPAYD